MKAPVLSSLLLALLVTPQASQGRSIPARGLQREQRSDEAHGPDIGMSSMKVLYALFIVGDADAVKYQQPTGKAHTPNAPPLSSLSLSPRLRFGPVGVVSVPVPLASAGREQALDLPAWVWGVFAPLQEPPQLPPLQYWVSLGSRSRLPEPVRQSGHCLRVQTRDLTPRFPRQGVVPSHRPRVSIRQLPQAQRHLTLHA